MLTGSCLAAGVLALAGCGGSGAGAGARRAAPVLAVAERDFSISAPGSVRAGEYTLRVHNEGSTDHELIVVRDAGGRMLPLRPDGLTVREEAIEHDEAGSLEPAAAGATRGLRLHLEPGRYTFFCNMEGHYMAGMHAEVDVS